MSADPGLRGRRVLVVGLARSGKAAAEALLGQGATVVAYDRDAGLEGDADSEGSRNSVSNFTSETRRTRCCRGPICS